MQRELEADSYECVAQWMDTRTKTLNQGMAEACMSARGWMRVSTPSLPEFYAGRRVLADFGIGVWGVNQKPE
jgi:hypothetical protein